MLCGIFFAVYRQQHARITGGIVYQDFAMNPDSRFVTVLHRPVCEQAVGYSFVNPLEL